VQPSEKCRVGYREFARHPRFRWPHDLIPSPSAVIPEVGRYAEQGLAGARIAEQSKGTTRAHFRENADFRALRLRLVPDKIYPLAERFSCHLLAIWQHQDAGGGGAERMAVDALHRTSS
jgi:hypothetical protein